MKKTANNFLILIKSVVALFIGFIIYFSINLPINAQENQSENLIQNNSVEENIATTSLPDFWYKGGYGVNDRILTYPVSGYNSEKAVKTEITSYSDGDAKWYFSDIDVIPGNIYTYSDYYISNVPNIIDVRYTMTDGSFVYDHLKTVDINSADYQKTLVSFLIPEDVSTLTIFRTITEVGYIITDEHVLIRESENSTNLVPNPGFEIYDYYYNVPLNWKEGGWGENDRSYSDSAQAHTGDRAVSVSITSITDEASDAKWYFEPISLPAGDYNYSDYYKSDINSIIALEYRNLDDTYSYVDLLTLPPVNNYTKSSVNFSVPNGARDVTVFHLINNVGTLTIDDVSILSGFGESTGTIEDNNPPADDEQIEEEPAPVVKINKKSRRGGRSSASAPVVILASNDISTTTNSDTMTDEQIAAFVSAFKTTPPPDVPQGFVEEQQPVSLVENIEAEFTPIEELDEIKTIPLSAAAANIAGNDNNSTSNNMLFEIVLGAIVLAFVVFTFNAYRSRKSLQRA